MTYNQLIENTIVPAGMAPDEKSKQYEKVVNYVNSVLPSKLYRFRSVTERSLSALYNDELWFANGSTMNDDFEARLYYDKKELMNWLNSQISDEGGLKVLERLAGMDKMPDEIGQMIPNPIAFFNAVKNMTREQINELSSQFVKFIADNLDVEVINATNRVQEMTKFACFTEKINSDMMWGQYAASATGFALEYNFGEQNTVVCGCVESVEIGTYNTCKNGCVYCYANYSSKSVENNAAKYDPLSPLLCGQIEKDDKINIRKVKSLKETQISFFDL